MAFKRGAPGTASWLHEPPLSALRQIAPPSPTTITSKPRDATPRRVAAPSVRRIQPAPPSGERPTAPLSPTAHTSILVGREHGVVALGAGERRRRGQDDQGEQRRTREKSAWRTRAEDGEGGQRTVEAAPLQGSPRRGEAVSGIEPHRGQGDIKSRGFRPANSMLRRGPSRADGV